MVKFENVGHARAKRKYLSGLLYVPLSSSPALVMQVVRYL
jgi:hypothetical protein